MTYSELTSRPFFVRKIVLHGQELEVEFRYYAPIRATQDEPESPEEVMIEAVYLEDHEITHLCGRSTMAKIEEELLKLYDSKEEV